MARLPTPSRNRDALAALVILFSLLLAAPILGSFLSDWQGSHAVPSNVALQPTPILPTQTIESIPSSTPTLAETSTLTPTNSPAPTLTTTSTLSPTSSPAPTLAATSTLTPTSSPASTPTATPPIRLYLLPFHQVFAVGQSQPLTTTPVLLYTDANDVFLLIKNQPPYLQLQTLDGKLIFWTAIENVSTVSPASAQYDFSLRDKTASLPSPILFACARDGTTPAVFIPCQRLANVPTAKIIARITAATASLFLVEINGRDFYLPAEAVVRIF